jgi:WD40 repeat protein
MSVEPIQVEKTAVAAEFKHSRPLTCCHWHHGSNFIFFGAEDHLVHRYDCTAKSVVSLAAHDSWVRSLANSKDGATLYSGGYDGKLIFWPATVEKPAPQRTIEAHAGWLRAIAVSPDGQHIATCGNDRKVKLWVADSGELVQTFSGHKHHVYNIIFSTDSSTLYSCDLKGVVYSWDIAGSVGKELVTAEVLTGYDTTFRADIGGARDISMKSDGLQLALSGISKVTNAFAGVGEVAIALIDQTKAEVSLVLETKDKVNGTMWGVTHHPGDFWIGLSGGRGGGHLFFWKGDTQHEFFKLKLKASGRGMSMSPDGTSLAVAHADMHLRTYQIQ